MDALLRMLPGSQPLLVRHATAAALVLLTLVIRIGIADRTGTNALILFMPAIVMSSLLFDRGSGFVALVLSVAGVAALLDWSSTAGMHVSALASFLIVGAGLVFVSEGLRTALERAYRAEREKDLLLQEMSHRVKNKFAMIASIIGLQARGASPEMRTAMEAISGRVRVIASVHDSLQLSRHNGGVDMVEYLGGLSRSLGEVLGHLRPVTLSVESDAIELLPEKALVTGLIVNELVTNAFKYAFPDDRPGRVHVRLARSGEAIELSVTDDGVGCGEQVEKGQPGGQPGLGTKLVTLFVAQLGGSARWEATGGGCRATATFHPA